MRWWVAQLALTASLGTLACADDEHGPDPCRVVRREPPPAVGEVTASLDGLDFDEFVDRSFAALLRRDPELLSEFGLAEAFGLDQSQLTDVSASYRAQTRALEAEILTRLRTFEPAQLSAAARQSHAVYLWYLEDREAALADWPYPVTHMVGDQPNGLMLFLSELHPIRGAADADDYINRLCQVHDKMLQTVAALDRAESQGVVLPAVIFDWALDGVRRLATSSPGVLDVYTSFVARVGTLGAVPQNYKADLYARAQAAIETSVLPGLVALQQRLERQRGRAPATIGLSEIAGGADYYDHLLRHHTTTDWSAAEIHTRGLEELERIHAEMRLHFDDLGYPQEESLTQLYDRVSRDGGSLSGAAVAAEYERLARAAEQRLGEAFDVIPTIPWAVIADRYGGFYIQPSLDGSRPGAFYAATSGTHPRYSMPTLTHHELIPGHHLQLALALESDLPLMRRLMHPTGFIEGWALYAERLAADLGWYATDPHADLGRLQMEAFRAARLVVDTGIHARGWSFNQAVSFMRTNTGFRDDVVNLTWQVGRYVAMPGQATAYMSGMLELLALRQLAQDQLGAGFDLPDFHTTVLGGGSVPLEVLRWTVEDSVGL